MHRFLVLENKGLSVCNVHNKIIIIQIDTNGTFSKILFKNFTKGNE